MERGGGRKRSTSNDSNSSCKKTRQGKPHNSFSCERHREHHVTNTSMLQGNLKEEFAKILIKSRAVNLWNSSSSSVIGSSCDLHHDETSADEYHDDDLYCNHLNKVQLPWCPLYAHLVLICR